MAEITEMVLPSLVYIETQGILKGKMGEQVAISTHLFYSSKGLRIVRVEDKEQAVKGLEVFSPYNVSVVESTGIFNNRPWKKYAMQSVNKIKLAETDK